MAIQQTSLDAYADLRSTLSQRERAVWHALGDISAAANRLRVAEGHPGPDPVQIDRRVVPLHLTALLEKGCVETRGKRPCTVTGKTALTWRAIAGRPPVKPQPKLHTPADLNRAQDGCLF